MNVLDWSQAQIIMLTLITLRMLAFFFSSAIFGSPQVMPQVKILLSLVCAFLFLPTLQGKYNMIEFTQIELISAASRELMVGLCIGFLTRIFFHAVSAAGELISTSMGLSSAQLYNPTLGGSGTVIEQFHSAMAILFFLTVNGHHEFIRSMYRSFEIFPLNNGMLHFENFDRVALVGNQVFLLGIKMSAPIMVAVLVTNLAMGILGRAVPQINVMITGFSVTIVISLGLMIILLPLLLGQMMGLLNWNFEFLNEFLKII